MRSKVSEEKTNGGKYLSLLAFFLEWIIIVHVSSNARWATDGFHPFLSEQGLIIVWANLIKNISFCFFFISVMVVSQRRFRDELAFFRGDERLLHLICHLVVGRFPSENRSTDVKKNSSLMWHFFTRRSFVFQRSFDRHLHRIVPVRFVRRDDFRRSSSVDRQRSHFDRYFENRWKQPKQCSNSPSSTRSLRQSVLSGSDPLLVISLWREKIQQLNRFSWNVPCVISTEWETSLFSSA